MPGGRKVRDQHVYRGSQRMEVVKILPFDVTYKRQSHDALANGTAQPGRQALTMEEPRSRIIGLYTMHASDERGSTAMWIKRTCHRSVTEPPEGICTVSRQIGLVWLLLNGGLMVGSSEVTSSDLCI
jgi:hypothetical protein